MTVDFALFVYNFVYLRLFTCDRTPDILQRPVMSFVLQWNDLDSLTIAMTQALRKAACRTYALQALNW